MLAQHTAFVQGFQPHDFVGPGLPSDYPGALSAPGPSPTIESASWGTGRGASLPQDLHNPLDRDAGSRSTGATNTNPNATASSPYVGTHGLAQRARCSLGARDVMTTTTLSLR